MKKRKICVVTGSRAEYGLLYWLIREICKDHSLHSQIIATGTHLSAVFGSTYRDIERDGFTIAKKIPILTSDDSALGVTRSLGKAVTGFATAFRDLKPDWLVVLGDRYEILAAVEAALIAKIPVAHLAGGDITEGAVDDSIRHAITKMSHLHFATHAASARRIRQLGEDPKTIFCPGHIGLDGIRNTDFLSRFELEKSLRFKFRQRNFLITFHPATLDRIPSLRQLDELLSALGRLGTDTGLIFTASNADREGIEMNRKIKSFVSTRDNTCFIASMGQRRYLSAMKYVDVMVGNSSSGIYEAPSFKLPTVNIGDRQRGRQQATSVINCPPQASRIYEAILKALKKNCSKVTNPYGDGRSAPRILRAIKKIRDPQGLLKKKFCDI
jgi:UDP-N-acetylglucosamine 2-epimerase (non-hydrolysing)/GDP/UDP-N,N'-diacetylbacillosamine 2-epimerase (hydrolysing)